MIVSEPRKAKMNNENRIPMHQPAARGEGMSAHGAHLPGARSLHSGAPSKCPVCRQRQINPAPPEPGAQWDGDTWQCGSCRHVFNGDAAARKEVASLGAENVDEVLTRGGNGLGAPVLAAQVETAGEQQAIAEDGERGDN